MQISSLTFFKDGQPDFDKLKTKGWSHPQWGDTILVRSLRKTFGRLEVQVVQQPFTHGEGKYTIAYVHISDEGLQKILRHGEGVPFDTQEVIDLLKSLDQELA